MADNFKTVRIREGHLNWIDNFVKTKGEEQGITNIAQVIDKAVSEFREKQDAKRFEHFNLHENIIRVLDRDIGRSGDIVELFLKENSLGCGYCNKSDCIHIKFVFTDPELSKKLIKKGVKSPFI